MTQGSFDFFDSPSIADDAKAEIAAFKAFRAGNADRSTVAAEVGQLRSVARIATSAGLSLLDLMKAPSSAARLVESNHSDLSYNTVLLRVRALQRFAWFQLGPDAGRKWIEAFRQELPKKESRGWHDAGVSLPGKRARIRSKAPTPDAQTLHQILEAAYARSLLDAAIAGLVCFSGLELGEVTELRWRDIAWNEQVGWSGCMVKVARRGRDLGCRLALEGTRPLLALAMASSFNRDAHVFPGRADGNHLSVPALRARLTGFCRDAGWPGLSRSQLTAAFALWLRSQGLDDHSVGLVIGRSRAACVDRLLQSVESLSAQLQVDEAFESTSLTVPGDKIIMQSLCNEWFS